MVISLFNIKGGVGKTTTAVNLAYLAKKEGKTLLIDLDPQGSATFFLGKKVKKREIKKLKENIKKVEENLYLIPADIEGKYLFDFKEIKELEFDYIFIDAPNFINQLTKDILSHSDLVLVPVLPNPLAIRSYNQILNFSKRNIKLFINMLENKPTHKKIIKSILSLPKHQYLNTYIPKSTLIENMPLLEIITKSYPNTKEAKAYQKLFEEIKTLYLQPFSQ